MSRDFPFDSTLAQMGMTEVKSEQPNILDGLPTSWRADLWHTAQAEILDDKRVLMSQFEQGQINREQFADSLAVLNRNAAEIYQQLQAEQKSAE